MIDSEIYLYGAPLIAVLAWIYSPDLWVKILFTIIALPAVALLLLFFYAGWKEAEIGMS